MHTTKHSVNVAGGFEIQTLNVAVIYVDSNQSVLSAAESCWHFKYKVANFTGAYSE